MNIKKQRGFFIVLILVVSCSLNAQKEASIWYFGHHAGLNFNTNPPTAIEDDNEMATFEGCTAISDSNGNLLFYSDGIRVWDKNHDLMKDASGRNVSFLKGDPSATQSGLVVPDPGNDKKYYLFSLPRTGRDTGYYSIVDFSSNPLGIATNTNTAFYPDSSVRIAEKITATLAKNHEDVWVLTHEASFRFGVGGGSGKNDNFVLHKITKSGIQFVKKQSIDLGNTNNYLNLGAMKFSPDGTKVAVATYSGGKVAILDFDNATGDLTLKKSFAVSRPFGVEFSPNSKVLYVSHGSGWGGGDLTQFDLTASDIRGSGVRIYARPVVSASRDFTSCMQIGIDQKVYVSKNATKYIAVINKPNVVGTGCDYVHNGIDLNPSNKKETKFGVGYTYRWWLGYSTDNWGTAIGDPRHHGHLGLPNFIQSFFLADIKVANKCLGDETNITSNVKGYVKYEIDFGDGTPKKTGNITADKIDVKHRYASAGNHDIRLKLFTTVGRFIVKNHNFSIFKNPTITFNARSVCIDDASFNLNATPAGGTYTGMGVSSGQFDPKIAGAGRHRVTYEYKDANDCTTNKTVIISVKALPNPGKDGSIALCQGAAPTLAQLENAIRGEDAGGTWSPAIAVGVTTYTYTLKGSGICSAYDATSKVTINYQAKPNAGTDGNITLCAGDVPTVGVLENALTGEDAWGTWSPAIAPGITTYTYTVNAKSPCTRADTATVTIGYQAKPNAGIGKTINLCEGETPTLAQLQNAVTGEDAGGTWSPTPAAGITSYTYTVSAKAPCTSNAKSIVTIDYQAKPKAGNDATLRLCVGEKPTLLQLQNTLTGADAGGTWSPTPAVGVTSYTYTVNAKAPCTRADTATVTIDYQAKPNAGTDAVLDLCEGDIPSIAQLQNALTGADAGGTWSPTPAVGVTSYTYTVRAISPCTSIDDTAKVTVRYTSVPKPGNNSTMILCNGQAPTIKQLQNALTGEDAGGTWSPTPAVGIQTYTYTLRGRGSCSGSYSAIVTIDYVKRADAGLDGFMTLCEGTIPTIAQLQDAITGEDAGGTWSPTPAAGITAYIYTVNTRGACKTKDISYVNIRYINLKSAGTDGTLKLCSGAKPTLAQLHNALKGEDLGGTWSPSLDAAASTYTYSIRSGSCPAETSKVTIRYGAEVKFEVQKNNFLCPEQGYVSIDVKNPADVYDYKWYDDFDNLIGDKQSIRISKTGNYYLEVIEKNFDCKKSVNINVKSREELPKVTKKHLTFSNNDDRSETLLIELEDAADHYEFAIDQPRNFVNDLMFNVGFGAHKLYVKDKKNCFKTYSIDFVVVRPDSFFTPNNDGIGDIWTIKGLNTKNFRAFRLNIMDRYGTIIKSYSNQFTGWNGRDNNGQRLQNDDYWYQLIIKNQTGSQMVKTGHFSLVTE